MRAWRPAAVLAGLLMAAGPARAGMATPTTDLRRDTCAGLAQAVDAAAPGAGAVFVASYPTATAPALRGTAFVYDNALAAIALLACGDPSRAGRIGDALRIAAGHDRFWHDGRLRNAYRAGPVAADAAPALPGWWDAAAGRWDEDGYQVGTATGNVAWAALSLLAVGTSQDRAAAATLMGWVEHHARTARGYAGGVFGEEPHPTLLTWLSTEHNVDAAAAFAWLGQVASAAHASAFVAAMWDPTSGHFFIGTVDDGTTINRAVAALDAELWPLIGIHPAPADWRGAEAWVRTHCAVGGGYGFRDGAEGIWTEGTAQAVLVLHDAKAAALLLRQRAPDGLLHATPDARVGTGLALRPNSTTDDFSYFHLPHLGATAWAALAATGTNPFVPARHGDAGAGR